MTEPQMPVSSSDPLSRRTFLHTLGAVSGGLMLTGLPQVQAQSASSTPFQLKAPEPTPKYGGTDVSISVGRGWGGYGHRHGHYGGYRYGGYSRWHR